MASSESGTMQAVGISENGPSSVLKFVELPMPKPRPKDLVVQNKCAGVNPVDSKVREGIAGGSASRDSPFVLGWDAAGIVTARGEEVTGFDVGDEVYYAGDVTRHGSYAEYTAVDYRAVARKPTTLTFEQAAVIPLVALTAWEAMVESQHVQKGQTILLYNGAGGVGSFAIQLAKELGLIVIATGGRSETMDWCKKLGADHVINHRSDVSLKDQLQQKGLDGVDHIFHLHDPNNIGDLMRLLKPLGSIAFIVPPSPEAWAKIDLPDMFAKRKSIYGELMFSRLMFNVQPERQGQVLSDVAKLIDEGRVRDIKTSQMSWKDVVKAHDLLDSGKVYGKIALIIDEGM